jgi:hypothetical protein
VSEQEAASDNERKTILMVLLFLAAGFAFPGIIMVCLRQRGEYSLASGIIMLVLAAVCASTALACYLGWDRTKTFFREAPKE